MAQPDIVYRAAASDWRRYFHSRLDVRAQSILYPFSLVSRSSFSTLVNTLSFQHLALFLVAKYFRFEQGIVWIG